MHDWLKIRCPKLGGEVSLDYCLQEGGDLPCSRIIVCWQARLPVERLLRERLSPEQWDRCFNRPPKDKVVSLVELVEAAKERLQAGEE